jgi:hypothetical protein
MSMLGYRTARKSLENVGEDSSVWGAHLARTASHSEEGKCREGFSGCHQLCWEAHFKIPGPYHGRNLLGLTGHQKDNSVFLSHTYL